MTILKSIGLIFLYERPPCLSGLCSNDDDDDDDQTPLPPPHSQVGTEVASMLLRDGL